ncbi:unnamed protein product [Pylaiella littoralis]
MKTDVTTATAAVLLCCSTCCTPTLSLVAPPPTRMRAKPAAPFTEPSAEQQWTGLNTYLGGCRKERRVTRASLARDDCCCCFSRTGRSTGHRRPTSRSVRRRDWAVSSKGLLGWGLSSSREGDVDFDGDIMSFEEFEKAFVPNAPGGRGGAGTAQQHGTTTAAAAAAAAAATTGISWPSLPLFFGVFSLLATPAIRDQVRTSLRVTLSGAGLGILGSLPLFAYGLALETRRDWVWVRKAEATTERAVLNLFGSRRQAVKVSAISVPLAALVGWSEECGFRGFLPLMLAAKTGLPTAAVVLLSGVFCGLFHAVSWAYFVNAALSGMFFHGLQLSTGNMFVPVVAHAAHNAFSLLHCHLKTSRPLTT